MKTVPASTRAASCSAVDVSFSVSVRAQIEAVRPKLLSFMYSTARSSEGTDMTGMTGPNVSSRMTDMDCVTLVSKVGLMKLPLVGRLSKDGLGGVSSLAPA